MSKNSSVLSKLANYLSLTVSGFLAWRFDKPLLPLIVESVKILYLLVTRRKDLLKSTNKAADVLQLHLFLMRKFKTNRIEGYYSFDALIALYSIVLIVLIQGFFIFTSVMIFNAGSKLFLPFEQLVFNSGAIILIGQLVIVLITYGNTSREEFGLSIKIR